MWVGRSEVLGNYKTVFKLVEFRLAARRRRHKQKKTECACMFFEAQGVERTAMGREERPALRARGGDRKAGGRQAGPGSEIGEVFSFSVTFPARRLPAFSGDHPHLARVWNTLVSS